jgi:hypothetical protein
MPVDHQSGKAAEGVLPEHLHALEAVLDADPTPRTICATLAELFHVHTSEVVLLRLDQNVLRFVHPDHLRNTGAIPIGTLP